MSDVVDVYKHVMRLFCYELDEEISFNNTQILKRIKALVFEHMINASQWTHR